MIVELLSSSGQLDSGPRVQGSFYEPILSPKPKVLTVFIANVDHRVHILGTSSLILHIP